ncbi:MAG: hypothetical protein AB8B99_24315 [Phormidesmis sp.]
MEAILLHWAYADDNGLTNVTESVDAHRIEAFRIEAFGTEGLCRSTSEHIPMKRIMQILPVPVPLVTV